MRKRIHSFFIAGCGLLVLSAVEAHASQQQWLRYCTGRESRQILGNIGSQQVSLSTDRPSGVGLPEFKTSSPLFGKWLTPMVTSGRIWLVLDRSKDDGPYDRLFIDSNTNDNLTDETVITAYRTEQFQSHFGPVKVVFDLEDGPVAYHLNLAFSNDNNRTTLSAVSGGWYEGTVTIDGRKERCLLIDQNANGTFNDQSDNAYDCDCIRTGEQDNLQTSLAGKEIVIGAVVYRPQIARDGAFVKFTAAEDVTYRTIFLPETIDELQVRNNKGTFTVRSDRGTGRLPVGQYQILLWKAKRKDEQGSTWELTGQDFGRNGRLDVNDSGQTNVRIGEPISCTMEIKKSGPTYAFSQISRGGLGEKIVLTCDGAQAPPPKLNIQNTAGSYNRTYSFEYG
jgi:hypothetical protein